MPNSLVTDEQLREIVWRSLINILRAFGRRYGFCDDIQIIKPEPTGERVIGQKVYVGEP